jgi:hypothetical protein
VVALGQASLAFQLRHRSPFGSFIGNLSRISIFSMSVETPSVRAPDFPAGLEWLHTGGQSRTLADFRGKVLILDFWTYG